MDSLKACFVVSWKSLLWGSLMVAITLYIHAAAVCGDRAPYTARLQSHEAVLPVTDVTIAGDRRSLER